MTKYFTITERPDIKTSEILALCKKQFPVRSFYDDSELDRDFPPLKKATTRYFKKVVEADEENKNLSAEDCDKKGIQGITLRERLLMELAYFEESGKHLDIENITLCIGSRGLGGDVPGAHWSVSEFFVYGCSPQSAYGGLRARAAVSLNPSSLNSPPALPKPDYVIEFGPKTLAALKRIAKGLEKSRRRKNARK